MAFENAKDITSLVTATGGYLQTAVKLIAPYVKEKASGNDTELAGLLTGLIDAQKPTKLVESQAKILAIADVLGYLSTFTKMVMDNVEGMHYSDRYNNITGQFAAVREIWTEFGKHRSAESAGGAKVTFGERLEEMARQVGGTPAKRFKKVFALYNDVSCDLKDQLDKEGTILNAYKQYRLALQDAEQWTFEVMTAQKGIMEAATLDVEAKAKAYDALSAVTKEDDPAAMAKLIEARKIRDAARLVAEDEQSRYRLLGKVRDHFKLGYAMGEAHQTQLSQTNASKNELYQTGVIFFSTQQGTYAMQAANVTAKFGQREGVETMKAMYKEMNQSLEDMAAGTKDTIETVEVATQLAIEPNTYAKAADALLELEKTIHAKLLDGDQKRAEAATIVRKKADELFNGIAQTRLDYQREQAALIKPAA
jgi:hypothetical protein